jgi:hypothetical protein
MLYKEAFSLLGEIVLIIIGLLFAGIALYTIFNNYRNAPRIEVNNESIKFGHSETRYWKDLEKIEMTGKWPFDFWGNKKEGIFLKFNGEEERYIFDDMYLNMPAIKVYIAKIVLPKDSALSEPKIRDFTKLSDGKFTFYDGRQLYSFNGIVLWSIILIFLVITTIDLFKNQDIATLLAATIISLLALILFSMKMKYFAVSDNCLLIKTHNFFWLKTIYGLIDVRELVFERGKDRSATTTLRIIFNDFTSATYPASTLWSKTWMQLKADLESKGIKVRNECVTYEPFEFKLFND